MNRTIVKTIEINGIMLNLGEGVDYDPETRTLYTYGGGGSATHICEAPIGSGGGIPVCRHCGISMGGGQGGKV